MAIFSFGFRRSSAAEVKNDEAGGMGIAAAPAAMNAAAIRLVAAAKWAILALVFLVPLAYLPVTQDAAFIKTFLVEIVAVIAVAAWLLKSLFEKRIVYQRTPLNIIFLGIAAALIISTIFSSSPWSSAWGPDSTGERLASVLAFIAIAFTTASLFEREDVRRGVNALLVSFFLLGLFTLVLIFYGRFLGQVPAWLNFNPAGSVNALAYVLAAGFAASIALALARGGGEKGSAFFANRSGLAAAASAILFLSLVLTAFPIIWVAIAAVAAVLLAFDFALSGSASSEAAVSSAGETGSPERIFGGAAAGVLFAMLAASVFFAFRPLPFASAIFQPPAEISPSLKATADIALEVLKSRPLFGVGPGNFVSAYSRFRDPALNSTPFWTVRFNHGFSHLATIPVTAGPAGIALYLALVAGALAVLFRAATRFGRSNGVVLGLAAGSFFVIVMWFLYAGNFTASFLLFAFLGFLGASIGESAEQGGPSSRWRAARRGVSLDAPALNFAASFAIVFAAALALVLVYAFSAQYAAEIYFNSAVRIMNLYGNVDTAKVFLDRATGLNPVSDAYFQARAQVSSVAIQRLVARAAANPSEDISAEFRQELSEAVDAAKRAASLSPANPVNWSILGQVYETVIPFVSGADRAALDAYAAARDNDPSNPALAFARGRVFMALADITAFQIDRAAAGERARLESARADALREARSAFEAAIALKNDYADANFLLAQVAVREGNLEDAIRRTESAAALAPNDVGVAFQLGFLYFRADDLDNAKAAFDRAVLLNDNYSNARYFLGLIYDRRGDRDAALSQFRKIAALNPDNDEVKKIIANLAAGKSALAGVVPPAPAPESRKEPPVREGKAQTPIKRP